MRSNPLAVIPRDSWRLGDTAAVAGQVGRALDLNGDADWVGVGSAPSLDDVNPRTLEMWVKRQGTGLMPMAAKSGSGGYFNAEIQAAGVTPGPNTVRLFERWSNTNTPGWYGSTQLTDSSKFYYVALTYNSTATSNDPSIYIDGVADTVTETSAPSGVHASDAANVMRIGAASWGEYFSGMMDEVRISKAIRSAGWIRTTYNTIRSPGSFISIAARSPSSNEE